jgi:hypothetical protein
LEQCCAGDLATRLLRHRSYHLARCGNRLRHPTRSSPRNRTRPPQCSLRLQHEIPRNHVRSYWSIQYELTKRTATRTAPAGQPPDTSCNPTLQNRIAKPPGLRIKKVSSYCLTHTIPRCSNLTFNPEVQRARNLAPMVPRISESRPRNQQHGRKAHGGRRESSPSVHPPTHPPWNAGLLYVR